MSVSRSYNRTKLLITIKDMGFPQSTIHDIMLLWEVLKTQEKKEEAAKRCIPLVENCKTEKELIEVIKNVVEQVAKA